MYGISAVEVEVGEEVEEEEGVTDWMNERRSKICWSMWRLAYCSHCRQYFRRFMLSSLTAAPIPPASSKTACHLERLTTWISWPVDAGTADADMIEVAIGPEASAFWA